MRQLYKTYQIKRALNLVKEGYTRKQAAHATKINIFSLNYWIAKQSLKDTAKPKRFSDKKFKTIVKRTIRTLEALL